MPVSLILPCYRPQPGWDRNIINELALFKQAIGEQVELIVVFDGDCETVTEDAIQHLRQDITDVITISYDDNRGKGYATRKGVAAATCDIVMYTDVDFPYSIASMASIYASLQEKKCDIAVGVKDEGYYSHVPAARRLISRGLRALTGRLLTMPITDTQCGLKGFTGKARDIFLSTTIDRYLFDLEFIYSAFKSGRYKIEAIPVTLKEGIRFRKMNYRILLPEMLNFTKLLFNRK